MLSENKKFIEENKRIKEESIALLDQNKKYIGQIANFEELLANGKQ